MSYFLPKSGEDPETFVEQTFQQNRLSKMDVETAANVLNNWSVLLARGGYYPQAAVALERAISLDPQASIYSNLSIVYDKLNRLEESARAAENGAKLAPDDVRLKRQLCTARLFMNQFREAVSCYEEMQTLVDLDDYNSAGYGLALVHAGFSAKAVRVLEKIPPSPSLDYSVLNALGMAFFMQKNYLKAAEKFKAAVDAAPDQGLARYNLAIVQLMQRNRTGALNQYKMLQEGNPAVAEKLSKILFRNKILDVSNK